jgi:hypothetical protein
MIEMGFNIKNLPNSKGLIVVGTKSSPFGIILRPLIILPQKVHNYKKFSFNNDPVVLPFYLAVKVPSKTVIGFPPVRSETIIKEAT